MNEATQHEIHLWDYVRVVLSRLHIAVTVFLAVIALAAIYSLTRVPKYQAEAQIEIKQSQINITNTENVFGPEVDRSRDREFMPTQLKLITSQEVLEKLLKDNASIEGHPAFRDASDPVRALERIFRVNQERNARLINISVLHESPVFAKDLVNALVSAYIEFDRERRMGVSEQGVKDLDLEIDEQRSKLAEADRAINDFKEQNGINSFEQEMEVRLETLKGLNENYWRGAPIRLSLKARAEAAQEAFEKKLPLITVPEVLQNSMVNSLMISLAQKKADLEDAKARYGESHPERMSLEKLIPAMENNLREVEKSIVIGLLKENEVAQHEDELLSGTIQRAKEDIAQLNDLQLEYDIMKQNRDGIQRTYERVSQRREEIEMANRGAHGDFILPVYWANRPKTKAWPSHFKNLIVAGFLGSLLAIGTCFFMNYMDTTMKDVDDVRAAYGCEVLGSLPPMGTESVEGVKDDFIAIHKPLSHFAEAFRMIRTNLAFAGGGSPPKIIAVSSALPSEGKSIVSINVAIAQAQLGKRTLLVDADMRKPRLHNAFDLDSNESGLAKILAGTGDLSEMVKEMAVPISDIDNLYLMPSGGTPKNPAELLESKRFDELVEVLNGQFDYVVFDSPPSTSLVDSFIIANKIDGLVLVVKTFSTPKGTSMFLAENLRTSNIKLLGAVCNNKDMPKASRFSYYYSKYGRYGYGKYGGYYYYYTHSNEEEENTSLMSRIRGRKGKEKAEV